MDTEDMLGIFALVLTVLVIGIIAYGAGQDHKKSFYIERPAKAWELYQESLEENDRRLGIIK